MSNSKAAHSRAAILRFPIDPTRARDELNLCEFPLAVLADRVPEDCLQLTFTDSVRDESTGEDVPRTLHISAPPKYGLPTAKDEEVLLALIHLTDQINQFREPTVSFTRYELIRLLGWNEGGKSYRRLRESIARWKSVTLDYRNAWRDHRTKSWASEMFSIIDNVTIFDAEDRKRHHAADAGQPDLPLSSFTWNKVFFESMQAKYFKRLDFGFYQQLRTPTSKRLFRFLDKRFGSGRKQWDFDLREFAFEHIGLSRNYHTGKIKEKLAPAITELEHQEFLVPMLPTERYRKKGNSWRVHFVRQTQDTSHQSRKEPETGPDLINELTNRGVSPGTARQLVAEVSAEALLAQLDIFDWMSEHGSENIRNPAGYLVEAIRNDFAPSSGYCSREEREQRAAATEQRQREIQDAKRAETEQEEARRTDRARVAAAREALSEAELKVLEQRAMEAADAEQKKILQQPTFGRLQLQILVDDLIRQQL